MHHRCRKDFDGDLRRRGTLLARTVTPGQGRALAIPCHHLTFRGDDVVTAASEHRSRAWPTIAGSTHTRRRSRSFPALLRPPGRDGSPLGRMYGDPPGQGNTSRDCHQDANPCVRQVDEFPEHVSLGQQHLFGCDIGGPRMVVKRAASEAKMPGHHAIIRQNRGRSVQVLSRGMKDIGGTENPLKQFP